MNIFNYPNPNHKHIQAKPNFFIPGQVCAKNGQIYILLGWDQDKFYVFRAGIHDFPFTFDDFKLDDRYPNMKIGNYLEKNNIIYKIDSFSKKFYIVNLIVNNEIKEEYLSYLTKYKLFKGKVLKNKCKKCSWDNYEYI